METKRVVNLTPDLRQKADPELGEIAPINTRFYFNLEVKQSLLHHDIGKGVFAKENIYKGSIILIGGGQITSDLTKAPLNKDYAGVFDENYYIAPLNYDSPTPNWFINHSCNPNVKIIGRLVIIARHNINCGDELTIDYATVSAGDVPFKMKCNCGYSNCRNIITNNDWKQKKIFYRRFEEWPPFIQSRGISLFNAFNE